MVIDSADAQLNRLEIIDDEQRVVVKWKTHNESGERGLRTEVAANRSMR